MDIKTQRVAAITGGSRGIGYAVAESLAQEGFCLGIFGTSNLEKVQKAMDSLGQQAPEVVYVQGSLSQTADREAYVCTLKETFGHVDVLVNNAGIAPPVRRDILETTEESFDLVMDVNLKGTFFLTQAIANLMLNSPPQAGQRTIINIGSISSYASSPNRGEYCISKAGLGMVTKLFAHRLAASDIRVYEVRPGPTKTDMTASVAEKYDAMFAEGLAPINRWGTPEDVASAVRLLCSGQLPYSTGEVINVDGGMHIARL